MLGLVLSAILVSPALGGVWTNCGFAKAGCPGGWFRTAICSCQDCSSGRYCPSGGKGYWHRPHCPSGKYQPHSRKSFCYSCPRGKYQPGSGKTSCHSCPSGKYQPNYARTYCYSCPAGKFQPSTSQTYCHSCPAGKTSHTGAQWSSHCSNCPSGKYAPSSASSSCSNCPSGKYSGSGASSCANCPAGKYASSSGRGSCAHCPSGRTTLGSTGRSSCSTCPLGKYYVNAHSGCPSCPAGKFQDEVSGQSCKVCTSGRYQPASSATGCLLCPVGKISTSGASSCTTVSPGQSAFCSTQRPCGVGLGTCSGDHECMMNLKCTTAGTCIWSGSKCCQRRVLKTNYVCANALPGTEYFTRGYSALVGEPIYEAAAQRSAVFKFSCTKGSKYQDWTLYDDVDATFWSRCLANGRDATIYKSYTTETMSIEATDYEAGYDKTWSVEGGLSVKGVSGSVATDQRLALTYSNSKTSVDGRKASTAGSTRKMEVKKKEKWYTAELKYHSVQLTDNFKQASYALAKNFNKEVLGWFATFGGWVLLKADMGSLTTRSMFIKDSATSSTVSTLRGEVKNLGFEFFGFKGGDDSNTQNSGTTTNTMLTSTSVSETQSIGYIPRKFESCGEGSESTKNTVPEPVPIRFGLLPLWDPAIPYQTISGLTWNEIQQMRLNLENFISRIQEGGGLCASTRCYNRGVCTPKTSVFQTGKKFDASQTAASAYLGFWNTDKCVCRNGWKGSRCQTVAIAPLWETELAAME